MITFSFAPEQIDAAPEIVNGVGSTVNGISSVIRKAQTGHIGFYIFGMVIGIIAILFYTFIK